GESLAFARDPQTKRWRLIRPRTARADTQAVTGLIRQAFDARRAQTDQPPRNLAEWGLGDPPATGTLTLGKGEERSWWVKLGEATPGTGSAVIYVTSSDNPNEGMAVRKSELDDALKGAKDFRETHLLTSASSDIQ